MPFVFFALRRSAKVIMGKEAFCTLRYAGKSSSGKALPETAEIIFRGDTRLKIPFSAITEVHAQDGELHVRTTGGLVVFTLGPHAAKWREKIANPRPLLDKLGVKTGQSVSLFGRFPTEFVASLKKSGSTVTLDKIVQESPLIFLAVDSSQELQLLKSLAKSMRGAMALWIVYPKGQKSIAEADVRSAGLQAGFVDIKVVSFSSTHTALKFVVPKSKR
jgi:hypothetical protein